MAYHATFHVIDTWKKSGKIWLKSPFYPKKKVIFEISKKKKCDFMCYTWYETIQHWHHWHCCWWQKTLDPRLVLQKIFSVLSQKVKITRLKGVDVSQRQNRFLTHLPLQNICRCRRFFLFTRVIPKVERIISCRDVKLLKILWMRFDTENTQSREKADIYRIQMLTV